MQHEHERLDKLQSADKAAVEEWIKKIRTEEALASSVHTVAQVDCRERAHFDEEEARNKANAAKTAYADALREELFGF